MLTFVFDLQRFADDDENLLVDDPDVDPAVDPNPDDTDPAPDSDPDPTPDDPENPDDPADDVDPEPGTPPAPAKGAKITFTAEQQAHVDQLVEGRVARAERSFQRQLAEAAGVELEAGEPVSAARLWGILKANPELSAAVQETIDLYVNNGRATMPSAPDNTKVELSKREAIVELKESDSDFAKNSKTILEWADENGFNVVDGKSLKLAYLAWKGENSALLMAQAQLEAQRKTQAKKQQKQGAALERGKGTPAPKKVDYRSMSDNDILANEGLSLFVDE